MNLADYVALLPSGTRGLQRFSGLFSAVLKQAVELQALVSEMETGFSLGSAVGVQLEMIGESFGIGRPLNMTDTDYRTLIQNTLKLWRWDGTNETAREAGVTPS